VRRKERTGPQPARFAPYGTAAGIYGPWQEWVNRVAAGSSAIRLERSFDRDATEGVPSKNPVRVAVAQCKDMSWLEASDREG